MSAASNTASASARIFAPAALYSSSEKPLPFPAPACTNTSCPSDARTLAPDGVIPTRYSLSLISVGTPMRIRGSPLRARILLPLMPPTPADRPPERIERARRNMPPRRLGVDQPVAGLVVDAAVADVVRGAE